MTIKKYLVLSLLVLVTCVHCYIIDDEEMQLRERSFVDVDNDAEDNNLQERLSHKHRAIAADDDMSRNDLLEYLFNRRTLERKRQTGVCGRDTNGQSIYCQPSSLLCVNVRTGATTRCSTCPATATPQNNPCGPWCGWYLYGYAPRGAPSCARPTSVASVYNQCTVCASYKCPCVATAGRK
ncbi:unnamed protein product [Didymodactylos carnosus]|uniref:Secreted protein n=1 Tax=Didymodactylos carnosus TaxID=1234261 RepID=A0A814G064_9BILA|nr:unnamed protein product [Didymodactylos carnosus]CAF1519942.1 unnamed protein product [Didymodactylos carnosus]CAF3761714.1 unnamed protein product [Didymodactylos carnosus]CAF4306969.1 unnamed protein product [Didymodactylos carnosus]